MSWSAYTNVRSLGVGALSEAMVARDAAGRAVVLKRLHRHLASDPACVEMFQHEARVLAALDDPRIVGVLDGPARDGDAWAFVQQCAPGAALSSLVAASPAMSVEAACELVAELLAALHHVHTRRDAQGTALEIVHRDVCPANVIVSREGAVALVDFGIATSAWRRDPDRGRMKGTRGYMAPEVITGERDADARADLWAAGVILFELLAHARLYEGPALRVMAAVVDGPVPSICERAPSVAPALDAVIQRALARDVDARWPSARAMGDALDAALHAAGTRRSRDALAAWAAR